MTVALFQNISRLHGGKPFFGKKRAYLPAHVAQWGERWTLEPTGSGSPVRAASALAICS